ncbi:MAG: RNA methyltransferase [Anaerolineae bacterium]|nr:RNA methyltransferase [Anaerolineae bacterium]
MLVFEGIRLVEEAQRSGFPLHFVLYTASVESSDRGKALLTSLREAQVACYEVSEKVLAACSDTETPQGILAVLPIPTPIPPPQPRLVLVLDRVRDPGNLGTILRTALAAGVEQVLLAPGTVDATNPKAVRAAMGAHLWLPVTTCPWELIAASVAHCDVWLASAKGETLYTAVDWKRPVALIVGGEASGAGTQAHALARGEVYIPMSPVVESLNTAVATAVLLFEVVRQRMALDSRCMVDAG